jgi:hypothetical protein
MQNHFELMSDVELEQVAGGAGSPIPGLDITKGLLDSLAAPFGATAGIPGFGVVSGILKTLGDSLLKFG